MKTVLIAEDSSVIQNLTKKILEFQNFNILSAKNGKEVLDILAQQNISIILMDINMPIMDGMECSRSIRRLSDPDKANTPIIAITGNAKNLTPEDFVSAGINDNLTKPLDFDLLVNKVKSMAK
jgi:CheY-like chemotaxis protein